jgi:hypothetical protein
MSGSRLWVKEITSSHNNWMSGTLLLAWEYW